ncbi:hypothetical protein lerEdw1_002272 [Lerista edwardsae]|nr:hypothetical protein lerEdw1_002272 [Lerista edwardsae]
MIFQGMLVFLQAGILAARPCLCLTPSCGRSLQIISLRWRKRDLDSYRSVGFPRVLGGGDAQAPALWQTHPRWVGTLALSQPSRDQFRLIYRFPGIKYCRAVSRLKLLQTTLTVAVLPPVWFLGWQNHVTQAQCLYSTGIACFAAIMLYGMSFYLRRIIGMMYLNEDGTLLRVAHLTFWGKRKDIYCPVETVMALSDTGDSSHEFLLQFRQHGQEEFFYFTLRFGQVLDPEGFVKVFGAVP